jgi:alkylresorcinol/alkylpyrone synthase
MPNILNVATASPPHVISQEQIKVLLGSIFGEHPHFRKMLPVFDNVRVEKRNFCVPEEWFRDEHTLTEINDHYIETAVDLASKAILDLASQCEMNTTDFDAIFFVSSTGVAMPTIDARVLNRIRLNPRIKRIPLWGLGCAGGASGIARAYDYVRAYPRHQALVVSVELCGLAFDKAHFTLENMVINSLLGDGAAACAVVGDQVSVPEDGRAHPSILGSMSTTYLDTLEYMTWKLKTEGFRGYMSRDIPAAASWVTRDLRDFLGELEIPLDSVRHFIFHPGGPKILHAFAEEFKISISKFEHSFQVLTDHGNMSSATILFVLKRFLDRAKAGSGDYGLLCGLGPGFSAEQVVLRF